MLPPHTRRPAALAHGEPCEDTYAVSQKNSNAEALKQPAFTSSADVESFTEELEIVAGWKEELQIRLARATICLQFMGDFDPCEEEQLERQIAQFNATCFGLAAFLSERGSK